MKVIKRFIGRLRRGLIGVFESLVESTVTPTTAVNRRVIGQSFEGRDITCYAIGSGKRKILFIGATHGNEVGTVKLSYQLLSWLEKNHKSYPGLAFYVVPCLNQDGYALAQENPDYWNDGRVGRFNGRGVDLNRNFPVKSWTSTGEWSHGKDYSEKITVNAGDSAGSEPEMTVLTDFMKKNAIDVYCAFHSAGRDVMGNENDLSQRLIGRFVEKTGYRFVSNESWEKLQYTGSAREWCDEQKIAYVEIEASTRWGSDWNNQQSGIVAILDELSTTIGRS